jgi:HAD superfamily hydrolase (TIGR01509 family)
MIKGLIFDFDGLILDTEGPVFQSWYELYQENGLDLSFEKWATIIGTAEGGFEPLDELKARLGRTVDLEAVVPCRRQREMELIALQRVLPGVLDYLEDAKRLGLRLSIASSSSRAWVEGHLSRLELLAYFDCLRTSDDVSLTKPDPGLFHSALAAMELEADQVIAFEDSPNGILAAKRAGLRCIAVPNGLTAQLDLSLADRRLSSLIEISLPQLLQEMDGILPIAAQP